MRLCVLIVYNILIRSIYVSPSGPASLWEGRWWRCQRNKFKGLFYSVALPIRFQQLVMRRREVLIRIYSQLRVRKVRVSGQVFKASAPKYTEKKNIIKKNQVSGNTMSSAHVMNNSLLCSLLWACLSIHPMWPQAAQAHVSINSWMRHALCDSVLSYQRNRWKFEHVTRNSMGNEIWSIYNDKYFEIWIFYT